MVGGLVQNQQLRRAHQRLCQRHALALAAGKSADFSGEIVDAQFGQHGFGLKFVFFPEGLPQSGKDLIQNIHFVVHFRRLGKHGNPHAGIGAHPARIRGFPAGQYLQKGGFTRAVSANQSDFIPGVHIKLHIRQKRTAAEIFRYFFRRKQHVFFSPACVFAPTGAHNSIAQMRGKAKAPLTKNQAKAAFCLNFGQIFPDAYCISRRNMGYYFL